ncbi:MAG: GTP-binding protein [Candidatus Competibacterales bacterium]|nr:GTP-binding protein [Candidatus Competibacterales bacterium]
MTLTARDRVPVSLLTGFLGSGKTTLLRHLLEDPALARSAVVVNEYGDTDFNEVALARAAPEVVPVNAACFCCTGRAQLVETLGTLGNRQGDSGFERVFLETSGLSDPAPVLQALINDRALVTRYRIDTVITVCDAVTGLENLAERPEARRQVVLADRVVITKTDVAARREIELLRARLRELNPRAQILEAAQGKIEPEKLLLSLSGRQWHETLPEESGEPAAHGHAESVHAWTLRRAQPVTEAGLALWMDLLAAYRGSELLRMKGLIDVAGRPVLVESIRHVFHPPVRLGTWPGGARETRVVVIAQGIERAVVERDFDALNFAPMRGPLDPQAYERFRRLMLRFGRTGRQRAQR